MRLGDAKRSPESERVPRILLGGDHSDATYGLDDDDRDPSHHEQSIRWSNAFLDRGGVHVPDVRSGDISFDWGAAAWFAKSQVGEAVEGAFANPVSKVGSPRSTGSLAIGRRGLRDVGQGGTADA